MINNWWAEVLQKKFSILALVAVLATLAFCNGRQAWAQQRQETDGCNTINCEGSLCSSTAVYCPKVGEIRIICDDKTHIPRPCNPDAPLPEFQGQADKFVEWMLAQNADLLEHQDEPTRTAIIEVMRTVGGFSYSVGYVNGLKKKIDSGKNFK